MKRSLKNPLLRVFGSLNLTLVILAIFAVAIATATFIEVRYGSDGARALVYNARWFEALLVVLVVNLIVSLFANLPYRRHQIGFLITHTGFIVVLVSAGITRFFGYEGNMPIREGTSSNTIYSVRDYVQLSMNGETVSFPVRFYKRDVNLTTKTVELGGEAFRVAVEAYWPHVEIRVVEGPGGRPGLVFSGADPALRQRETLVEGEKVGIQGVTVHLLREAGAIPRRDAAYGELIVTLAGEDYRLPVPQNPPAEITAGAYRLRISEFAPDYRVGQPASASKEMKNPAIRVEINGPNGERGERLLFAFHPDFEMAHGIGQKHFPDVGMTYRYERNLYLFRDGGVLVGHADFPLEIGQRGAHEGGRVVGAGKRFELELGVVMRSGAFAFLPIEFWESAVETPVASEDDEKPPGIQVAVTDREGNASRAVAIKWRDAAPIHLGNGEGTVSFGPLRIELPYRLHLDDFVLITYPGSNNPASFESRVRIFDEQHGVDGRAARIYMNHPLTYRGFKHFQSSYDRDRRGTVLSVNHDPGKLPTYLGYIFVGMGFLVTLTRGFLWYRRPGVQS